ncbi:hypothetical protein [Cognatilysobacter segetis]|uniref:hypothetical protein n=1 Tax=Cognatilysobacter segetis TaxID=2492394 RepID=UPI001061D6A1|nr:hypothetical protein [Lysobacter segetis]
MHATTETAARPSTTATLPAAPVRKARASDELYEFRRYNYADGWDSDDAALGWVDDEIVSAKSRRLH